MSLIRALVCHPGGFAALTVGLILGGLLVGYEPVGGDPDRIFRPIKAELARALGEGRLPFWSDRLGLGVPLVAESHAAAFYPPNLLLYRLLDVSTAYRLAMWAHCVGLAVSVFAYSRQLGNGPWGSGLAAVSFPLCGFLTVHSSHEWAYHTLAYLPLCLLAADRYAEKGGFRWMALLAVLWGLQITLGHFQIQTWTAGLVLLTGAWRVVADGRPLGRLIGLTVGVVWGAATAAVQLVPTWELAQLLGHTRRSFAELAFYSYPPSHWVELAVPGLFRRLRGGPEAPYWFTQQTTGFEACLFVGTVPLILAALGLVGGGRKLSPWRFIVPASFAMATMPRWWPQGYAMVLTLPGLGYFRCPARYTVLTSFGLTLLAGGGLDRAMARGRYRSGLALAAGFAAGAFAWALALPQVYPTFMDCLDDTGLAVRLGLAAVVWALGLWLVTSWRRGLLGAWALVVFTAAELGSFYYAGGSTRWGWSVALPGSSPVLSRLARDPGVVRVGGALDNLPVRAGLVTATPYTGFPLMPPHPLLKALQSRSRPVDPVAVRWLRRYGVTHLVWDNPVGDAAGEVSYLGLDPALDELAYRPRGYPERRSWRVVRLPAPFPEARVALKSLTAPDRSTLTQLLSLSDALDEAWYLPGESPPSAGSPAARSARVLRWDGLAGEVEHDGRCDLVVMRAYYPGWLARVGRGLELPTSRADGGLISVRLEGTGVSRIMLHYRPNGFVQAAAISAAAVLTALWALGRGFRRSMSKASTAPGPGQEVTSAEK